MPSGTDSTIGIGGLTLGGGFGHLSRKYGLTIDSLLAVDIVLADGRLVTASANRNPDLFWAVRGGGGNFAVVTTFLFKLHPISTVIGGTTLWSLENGADVMRFYRRFISQASADLNGIFSIFTVPPSHQFPEQLHLRKVCGVTWCYVGVKEAAKRIFAPIREFGPPLYYEIGSLSYAALQSTFDALYPQGLQWFWRSDFVNDLSDEAIALYVKQGGEMPSAHSRIQLFPVDGAVAERGMNDTAFSYRDAKWAQVIMGVDPDPAKAELLASWTDRSWEALHPYSAGGAYVNFMMDEGQERVRAAYRDNFDRLVTIKNQYDAANLFHINQNIKLKPN